MPRPTKWPPTIYRHSTGQAFIRVKGQPVYLRFPYAERHRPENHAIYERVVAEAAVAGPPLARAGLTVRELVARWHEAMPTIYSATSREPAQFRYAVRPLVRLYGEEPAADFGPKKLRAIQEHMARQFGWCRNVVNRRVARIQTLWRWAVREQLVPGDAHQALRSVGRLPNYSPIVRHSKPVRPSTWEDVDLVASCASPAPGAMLRLQWQAGMRSIEVRIIRTCDVDQSDPECWLYRPHKDKNAWRGNHTPRVVPLNKTCQEILRPWLRPDQPTAYIFEARPGQSYSDGSYPKAILRASVRATRGDGKRTIRERHQLRVRLTCYGGRHAAKRRITRELGLDAARAVLGQSSLGTTNNYAAGIDLQHAMDAVKKLTQLQR